MRPAAQEAQTSGQVPSLPSVDGGAHLRSERLPREGGPHQPSLEPSGECPIPTAPNSLPSTPTSPGQTESCMGCWRQGAFIGESGRTGFGRAGGSVARQQHVQGPQGRGFQGTGVALAGHEHRVAAGALLPTAGLGTRGGPEAAGAQRGGRRPGQLLLCDGEAFCW